ncbi:hypothetical protein ACM6N5_01795 [Rossellomorea marisflavi]
MVFSSMRWFPIFLVAFVLTMVAIWMNAPGGMAGYPATAFDLLVTVCFFLVWFLIGIPSGIKGKGTFLVFVGVYWGIGLVAGLLAVFAPYEELLLFGIWYSVPAHGLGLLLGNVTLLKLVAPFVGLGVSLMGYGTGRMLRQKEPA